MADRKWTKPQSDAISARGGSVLVSAAAGSGKTAVLVERVMRMLCDSENPVDADRLLVVTFSRAAAAEMKQRMGERLAAMLRDDPESLHLQRQQALLAGAQISTVDSFCLELVRQNFQNLEISPDFSVIDQNELAVIQADCAADCVAWFYENDADGLFPQLVELLAGRDDRQLIDTILRVYEFSRSHPFPERWLAGKLDMYADSLPVAETVWGKSILRYAGESLEYCLGLSRRALEAMECDDKMRAAYESAFLSDIARLEECVAAVRAGDWDGAVTELACFDFPRLGSLRGEDQLKQRVKDSRDQVKDTVKTLAGKYLNATGGEFREDIDDLRPKIELLFRMVEDFSARLWAAKSEKKRLHFADIEHLALRLLAERGEDGVCRATAVAEQVAERYDYVLVDEYQDTNEVQDLIFTCVSRRQTNLFMVGDVKQSIYSFRQAMPEIFMAKRAAFFPYGETGQYPARITLDTNFRSRREVTEAVNFVFGLLMSEELGGVKYDEAESLKCGASYAPSGLAAPELVLVTPGEDDRDPVEIEAEIIARRIRAMIEESYPVEEGGALRPAMQKDFCVLMRSPKGRAEVYVKELARHGVTAVADNAGGYLETREVAAVVSLLRALDNPLLDIELVAAMLSPLFGFEPDDVARIRLEGRGEPFFNAVSRAAESGDEKAAGFLRIFRELRAASAVLPADRLIMRVYEQTDALCVFRAMSMGERRRANLLMLIEYAADYHKLGYKRLGGFVGFLGRLAEKGGDLAPAAGQADGRDAVRVMSIHRSKGLEFPVVFLADSARGFNKVDLRQNTMLHARFGFACVRRDYNVFKQYPTVPMQAIRLEARRSILSEELRILYVALTRAREKLIVTGTVTGDPGRRIAGLCCGLDGGALPAYRVGECGCYLDWLLMALAHHQSCGALRELAGVDDVEIIDDGNSWLVSVVTAGGEAEAEPEAQEPVRAAQAPDEELIAALREGARWQYPYLGETKTPAKLAVSSVAKGGRDERYRFTARPRFLAEARLNPAERGDAMHRFMQFASYEAARADLDAEIARMKKDRFLSAAECESLDAERLRAFFRSPLAERIFASLETRRELRFMAECGPELLGGAIPDGSEGKIVLQGVADCVFIENGGAVIVDYKTDRVSSPDELRERYGEQLRLYRAILAESLGAPVKECVVYSFHLSMEVLI